MTGLNEILLPRGAWAGAPDVTPPPPAGIQWQAGGWDAGGHTNWMAFNPSNPNDGVASTDVDGSFSTPNRGESYDSANSLVALGDDAQSPASLFFDRQDLFPGYALLATGGGGSERGLWLSRGRGRPGTWVLLSRAVPFHGNNTNGYDLPQPHPRRIGRLLAVDCVNRWYYAYSFNGGVMRCRFDATGHLCNDDGTANPAADFYTIGFKSGGGGKKNGAAWPSDAKMYFSSAIVLDPNDPDNLYVCDQARNAGSTANYGEGHVWRCTNPRDSVALVNWQEFVGAAFNRGAAQGGSPQNVQDLEFDRKGALYGVVSAPITWNGGLVGGTGGRDSSSFPAEGYAEQGLYRLASPKAAALNANWRIFIAANSPANRLFCALDIGTDGAGNDRIAVTCGFASDFMPLYLGDSTGDDCFASSDGAWRKLVPNASYTAFVLNEQGGRITDKWWQFTNPSGGKDQFSFRDSPSTFVHINELDFNDIILFGRPFRTKDASSTIPTFRPYTGPGLLQLNLRDITTDPRVGKENRVYACASDAWFLMSVDGGATPILMKRPGGQSAEGYSLTVDPDDGRVYIACGDDGMTGQNGLCEIWRLENPDAIEAAYLAGSTTAGLLAIWTRLKTDTEAAFGTDAGLSCIALVIVKNATGDKWVIGAFRTSATSSSSSDPAPPGGVYRFKLAGSGTLNTWTKSASTFVGGTHSGFIMQGMGGQASTGSKRSIFAYRPGSNHVWLFDRRRGVYRSSGPDIGAAWGAPVHASTRDDYAQGHVAVHPDNDDVVFVSRADAAAPGVYQVGDAAHPASAMTAAAGNVGQAGVRLLFLPVVGPLAGAVNPGAIQSDGRNRKLFFVNIFGGPSRVFACSLDIDMTDPSNWIDVSGGSTSVGFNQAWGVEAMHINQANGRVYTANKGGAAVQGIPS